MPKKIGRIEVKKDICIGAGACEATAPKVFKVNNEGKAEVLDVKGDMDENILAAAKACPVQAIYVYDEEGKQLFP
jgi:ferredoxin